MVDYHKGRAVGLKDDRVKVVDRQYVGGIQNEWIRMLTNLFDRRGTFAVYIHIHKHNKADTQY